MIFDCFKKKKKNPEKVNHGTPKNPDWHYIWDNLKMDNERKPQISYVCKEILKNKHTYLNVEKATGVPWEFVACIHYRESSLSFKGVLHNGQRIIGTGRKTTWVPKGRGPFNSWEEAAIDAIKFDGLDKYEEWSFQDMLSRAERYNGLGYRRTGEYSPYVLAGTNFHDETGKYVSDGKYSRTAPEKQLGVGAILLGLIHNV